MKKALQKLALILSALACTIINHQLSTCSAQGTAFTYQGRLNDGGAPATGRYDLRFGVYDAASAGNPAGVLITNTAAPVTNGQFTVTLDFGSVFPGADRWLELGVRTNGSPSDFSTLAPRQQITPSPYAITAANLSGSVSPSQISGQISPSQLGGAIGLTQLPPGAVTNHQIGVTLGGSFTGAFAGDGSGLTNLPVNPAQPVPGSGLAAQPNETYAATNNSVQQVITLPSGANIGDIVQVSGVGAAGFVVNPGSGQSITGTGLGLAWTNQPATVGLGNSYWQSVAASADGSKVIAAQNYGGYVYTSTDGGVTWSPANALGSGWWSGVASSADGNKLVVVEDYGGQIYTSADGGTTWSPTSAPAGNWQAVASSSDGSHLVAVQSYYGAIYTSTDGGGTWTQSFSAGSGWWWAVASSSDGSHLVAAQSGGSLYKSADGGFTWTPAYAGTGASVASSADGSHLVAAQQGGQIVVSTDGGATWYPASAGTGQWSAVACSSDGAKILAAQYNGYLYVSTDSGATWTPQNSAGVNHAEAVAVSADGARLFAADANGPILTSAPVPVPLAGGPGTAVDLQYAGNGQWRTIAPTPNGQPALTAGLNSAPVIFLNSANSFYGNGGGLTGVNATYLNGFSSGSFWQIGGNWSTAPNYGNFLGTLDNNPLEIHVNQNGSAYGRAFRLEPDPNNNGAPNVIGGSATNSVVSGVFGATIAGGGTLLDPLGDQPMSNTVTNNFGTVGGGNGNSAGGASYGYATVGGGQGNIASGDYATVPGGATNLAAGAYSFAAGNQSQANYPGSFVWSDDLDGTVFSDVGPNTFNVRARGGLNFVTGGTGLNLDGPVNVNNTTIINASGTINSASGLIIENRTSDPPSPVTGQIWLRTDL